MKKFAIGIFCIALILGAGTAVFAAGNSGLSDRQSFEKMVSFMEKMHPDTSNEELKDMYKACHENGGMMNGTNGKEIDSEDMMNSF